MRASSDWKAPFDFVTARSCNQNLADKPKAYITFAAFDDQFKLMDDNSGSRQVKGTPDVLQTLGADNIIMKKSGFFYIYTTNERNEDVYFDNLVVTHGSGPLLEETHYYPFGLTMAGVSSSALQGANYVENKLKYNGKELQNKEFGDGSGLDLYDYGARMYDAQVGRWHVVDPMAEKFLYESPYVYAGNNPILNVDIGGNFKYPKGKEGQQYEQSYKVLTKYLKSGNLNKLLESQTLVNAFGKYGRLKIDQLRKDFTWGAGATLLIVDHPGNAPLFPNVRGHTSNNGEVIEISKRLVMMLESASPEDKEAALWWIVKVLLHEENHRGDDQNPGEAITKEVGIGFDTEVWSRQIEGSLVPYIEWPEVGEPDWQRKHLDRAREVIEDKQKTEEGRKMLPKMFNSGTVSFLNSLLNANPNIVLTVSN